MAALAVGLYLKRPKLSRQTRRQLRANKAQSKLTILGTNKKHDIVTAKFNAANEYISLSSLKGRDIEVRAEKDRGNQYIITFAVDKSLTRTVATSTGNSQAILNRVHHIISEQVKYLPQDAVLYAEPINADRSGRARSAIYQRWGFRDAGDGIGLTMPASSWRSRRNDAPEDGQGKPCGESHISKAYKCSKKTATPTSSNLNNAAKVALAVGVLAGGIYLTKKGSFIRKEEWDKHPANKLNNPKLTEAEAQKITDEAIAGGQKWDVQEKINARRRAEIHIECGGGLGKLLAPAKFDSYSSSPRCQAGEGAFGTYFVHPSEKYGVKLFRNGSYDDVASEFRRLDKADYAGVNVPSPLRAQAIKDIDGDITSQTLVLTHMKGYKTLGDVHSDGSNSARNAPTIVKRNIARQFRALHTAGLAHGDIHAGNLMVNPRSRKVALIDFGYATELPDRRQPSHGRNGVENLMDDLGKLPDFLGFPRTANAGGSTFIAKYKGVFANVEKQAQAFSKYGGRDNEQRFEIAIKRYHDALDTELLGEFRMPRSRFISGADQPRIPGLTRQLVAGNLNTVQRGIVEKLAVQVGGPSHFRQVAKGIGLNSARLRAALAPERGARIALQRQKPFGTNVFPRGNTLRPGRLFGARTRSLAADLPANARGTAGRLSLAARMQRILARSGNENMSREAALRLARNEQR